MDAIKEYLRSHHGIKRLPLAYIIRMTKAVQTYIIYPWHVTPNKKVITMVL